MKAFLDVLGTKVLQGLLLITFVITLPIIVVIMIKEEISFRKQK